MADNAWQTNAPGGRADESRAQQGFGEKGKDEEIISNVPPPPVEVKVRTMQSDLDEMAKSGGGLPRFEAVKVRLPDRFPREEEKTKKKLDLFWVVVPVLALALFAAIVYLVYSSFSAVGEPASPTPAQKSEIPQGPRAPIQPPSQAPEAEFIHLSLFRKPADETLTFVRRSRAESAAELETWSQRLLRVLGGAKQGSKFIEIRFQDEAGRDLRVDEILALPDALVLAPEFLLDKFNPDPTAFVYRDGGAFSPGYIFALRPEENWLFLREDVAKLELSSKLENLFLQSPGSPIGNFEDVVVGEQPARQLAFPSGATFIYGWFRGRLILSTSEEGLKEALARM